MFLSLCNNDPVREKAMISESEFYSLMDSIGTVIANEGF